MLMTSFLKLGSYSCCALKIENHIPKVKGKAIKELLMLLFF